MSGRSLGLALGHTPSLSGPEARSPCGGAQGRQPGSGSSPLTLLAAAGPWKLSSSGPAADLPCCSAPRGDSSSARVRSPAAREAASPLEPECSLFRCHTPTARQPGPSPRPSLTWQLCLGAALSRCGGNWPH